MCTTHTLIGGWWWWHQSGVEDDIIPELGGGGGLGRSREMTISRVDDVMCASWTADIWHYPHLMARVKSQHLCVVWCSAGGSDSAHGSGSGSGGSVSPVIIVKVVGCEAAGGQLVASQCQPPSPTSRHYTVTYKPQIWPQATSVSNRE